MRHSLASISRGFGGGGGDRSINSSRWDGASREEGRQRGPGPKTHWGAALTTSSASSASSPRGRGGGMGVGGRPELGSPLSQVLTRPCHSRLPEKRRKGARIERLDGGGHAGQPPPLCARSRWGRGRGCCGPRALTLCAPGRPKSDAPLRAAAAAAAAAAAPAAAAKRGLGSAQLLSNYPSTDLAAT